MLNARTAAFGIIACSLLPLTPGHSQGAPPCRPCEIAVRQVAVLGKDGDGGAISRPPNAAARDSKGRIAIVAFNELPRVYAADGKFLTELGRRGGGPGEFVQPALLRFGANDTLHVADAGGRLANFGPDLRYSRSTVLTGMPHDFLPLGGGELLLSAEISAGGRPGFSLHVQDDAGRIVRSVIRSERQPAGPPARPVGLSPAARAGFWTYAQGEFRFSLWSHGGSMLRTIPRATPAWFVEPRSVPRGSPAAVVRGVAEAGRILWVSTSVPMPDASRQLGSGAARERSLDAVPWDRLFHTMIAALDAETGETIAEHRLPAFATHLLDSSHLLSYALGPDDVPHLVVWELGLTQPRRASPRRE